MARKLNRLQRRGRTILLGALACFFFTQGVSGLLLDYRWPHLRFPHAWKQFEAFERMEHAPQILCLGSSRIGSWLNADLMAQELRDLTGRADLHVMNAAIPASDPITMEFAYAELVRRGADPDWLIVEICPDSFHQNSIWISQHLIRQLRWEDTPTYFVQACRTNNLGRLALARFLPLYLHRFELVRRCSQWVESLVAAPPAPTPRPPAPSADRPVAAQLVSRAVHHATPPLAPASTGFENLFGASSAELPGVPGFLRNYRLGGGACAALERLLAHCRQRGCNVLLLGAPVATGHRALYTPDIDQQYRHYVARLQATYGCHYRECRDRIPDGMFTDSHHAKPEAAVYFSRLLAEEVLQHLIAPAAGR